MNLSIKSYTMILSLGGLLVVGDSPGPLPGVFFLSTAEAIVGAPLSPVSFAGVARRTTRRAVVLTSAANNSQQEQKQQQQTETQPAPAQPAGSIPVGSIVPSVPEGCTPFTKDNVQYYTCAGNYYRAAFQGNNVVYAVVDKP